MAGRQDRERREKALQYPSTRKRIEDHEAGYKPATFEVPEGTKVFRFKKAGVYSLDIIPYVVGKGNPFCDESFPWYERTYYAHKGIGPKQEMHVCLRDTFGKECPVCEFVATITREGEANQKLIAALRPKERQLYLLIDRADRDAGVQIFETAYYKSLGEMLDAKIKASQMDEDEDEEGYGKFWHLEDGMTLKIMTEEDTFNGKTFYKPSNIEMVPRKEPLSRKLLDKSPCLDELLKELSYKSLKALLNATGQKKADDDDQDEDEDDVATKPKGSKAGKKPTRATDDDDDDNTEDEDTEDEDEDEDEDTPRRGGKKGSGKSSTSGTKKPSSKSDDDDEDEDVEADDDDTEADDDEAATIKMGSRVTFDDDKGKEREGEVVAMNKGEGSCTIKDDKGKRHVGVDLDECTLVESDEDDEGDDSTSADDDDENESPKSRKVSTKPSKKPSKASDEDEDDEGTTEDDDEGENDDIEQGDTVSWLNDKGQRVKGFLVLYNPKKDVCKVKQFNHAKAVDMEYDQLRLVAKYKGDDDDE